MTDSADMEAVAIFYVNGHLDYGDRITCGLEYVTTSLKSVNCWPIK